MATVYLTVYSVPVANDDSYTVDAGKTLTVSAANGVLANDTNADGNTFTAVLFYGPSGTLTLNPDGSFSYTPNPGFVGTDSFTYFDVNGPATSNVATVTINVLGVPVANPDSYTTVEDSTLNAGSVLANDTVGTTLAPILSAQLVSPPLYGMLTFNADGTFTYVPPTFFVGTTTFTYEAVNTVGASLPATVTITVTSANLSPTAYNGALTVPANTLTTGFLTSLNPAGGPTVYLIAAQGAKGTATITNASTGAYTYTPNMGASGTDTFTFSVAYAANPTLSSTATITVTILGTPAAGVVVTANIPSAQVVGTPITFTATATGIAGPLQYEFVAQYRNPDGTWAPNLLLQSWSANNQCTWTPTAANNYAVEAYACPIGGPVSYTTYGYLLYTILPNTITGVTLSANVPSPQMTGTAITLTAAVQGTIAPGTVQYQFVAQYRTTNGSWAPSILLQDWSTNNQCIWTPSLVENYDVVVYVRPVGMMSGYVATTYIPYNIESANLTGVTISANLPSPQAVGTPIVLTATAQGGITYPNVEYQFVAQYKLPNGTWAPNILIRDYDTNPQCSWTASAPAKYYLNVYARPVGSTVAYVVTSYIVYSIH